MNLEKNHEKSGEKASTENSDQGPSLEDINELRELIGFPPLDTTQEKSKGFS